MKSLYKVLNIFVLAAVIAILGGCFSPWEGDSATITIHVGGGSGRTTAFHLLDDDAKARISYILDLSGPSNMTDVPFAPGTQTINLSVAPGIYTITVTAYLDGEVYATGSTTAEARAGQSTPVDILMRYAGEGTSEETFTVTFDSKGGSHVYVETVVKGGMATRPDNPTWDGYGFVRWCNDEILDMEYDFETPVTSDITLYAQWSANTYMVTFKSDDINTLYTAVVGEGGTVTRPEENPTRNGYIFDGWYSNSSLTTPYNFDNQIYSDITIYAKWLQQFTVTFETNGGSYVPPRTITQGGTVTRPDNPTLGGNGFVRWCSDETLDTEYDFKTPVTSDITLYAQWSENTYTITFNSNDGSPIEDELVGEGGKVTPPADPTRSGYVFDNWYSNSSLTTPYNFDNKIYSDITIYAKWIPQFTVTFNTNGGSPVPPSQTVTQGGTVTPPADPIRNGYVFDGWYSDNDFTEMYIFANQIYSNTAIYAKWLQQFTVTFNSNGGSTVPTQKVTQGGKVTPPSNNPTQDGFVFDGWYSDNDFTTEYDFNAEIYSDTAIYAKWLQQFTVTFNTNGGSPVPAQQTVIQGGKVTRPLINPTQIGFVFDGWYSNDDFTTEYDFDTETYSDTAIYAKWNESIIEMVYVSAGIFTMGSPTDEENRRSDETQHSVTLTGFYMGKYEVTQEQYVEVMGMGSNPSNFKTAVAGESGTPGKLPVETVSWYDAIVFCNKLSMMEGLNPVYSISGSTDPSTWETVPTSSDATWDAVVMDKNKNGYRLPTEAEWEYACRAGTTTAWYTGNTEDGTPHLNTAAWYSNNASSKTHKVGLKTANAWGLYDMHGNVHEWCWDLYGNYPSEAQTDPIGAVTGTGRVYRGGAWANPASILRSAYRNSIPPFNRDIYFGFRLVRSLP
jgi:uncharacterized repeat protein (TIGR02543 family)